MCSLLVNLEQLQDLKQEQTQSIKEAFDNSRALIDRLHLMMNENSDLHLQISESTSNSISDLAIPETQTLLDYQSVQKTEIEMCDKQTDTIGNSQLNSQTS